MNLTFGISRLGGMLGDFWDTVVGGLQAIVAAAIYLVPNFFYTIFIGLAFILDLVQSLFRKMAGLESYSMQGIEYNRGDIAIELINNNDVKNVFISMMVLGLVLLIMSTFIAVIKSEYEPMDKKGSNSKGKIIGQSLRAMFNAFTVPVIAVLGLMVGNALLYSLDLATSSPGTSNLSGRVFHSSAFDANRARPGTAAYDSEFLESLEGQNHFGIFVEENIGALVYSVADKIDDAFKNNRKVIGGNHTIDFSTEEYDLFDLIGEPTYPSSFSIYNYKLVWFYYDLFFFNFFIGIGVAFGLTLILLQALLGLVKRLYSLVILFIVSPPIIAITPINPEAFKNWKKAFIGSALSAYSTVIVFNLFLMMIPVIGEIEFFIVATDATVGEAVGASIGNYFSQLLIILGGGVFFKDFSKQLAGMIGAEDALGEGAGKSKAFMEGMGKAAIATGTGIGAVAGIYKKGFKTSKKLAGVIKSPVDEAIQGWQKAGEEGKSRFGGMLKGAGQGLVDNDVANFFNKKAEDGSRMGFGESMKLNAKNFGDRVTGGIKNAPKAIKDWAMVNPLSRVMGTNKVWSAWEESNKENVKKKKADSKKAREKRETERLETRHQEIMGAVGGNKASAAPQLDATGEPMGDDVMDYYVNKEQNALETIENEINLTQSQLGLGMFTGSQKQEKQNYIKNMKQKKQNQMAKIKSAQAEVESVKKFLKNNKGMSVRNMSEIDIAAGVASKHRSVIQAAKDIQNQSQNLKKEIQNMNKKP
jgi:hypothetical protein